MRAFVRYFLMGIGAAFLVWFLAALWLSITDPVPAAPVMEPEIPEVIYYTI